MIIEALFLAHDQETQGNKTFVLIDVFRTSATLTTMLRQGARNVIVAAQPDEARAHRARLGSCLLCGEAGGRRLPDFDYGNSPGDYELLHLEAEQVVFTSSNGAKAMGRLVGDGRRVFVGSYPNATAVIRTALADAENRSTDIVIVASGRNFGTRYGIEDSHCAGFLVDLITRQITGRPGWGDSAHTGDIHHLNTSWTLEDSALIALQLYRGLGLDFDRLIQRSGDAQNLRSLGLGGDFPACVEVDTANMVPEVTLSREGYLVVNPALPA